MKHKVELIKDLCIKVVNCIGIAYIVTIIYQFTVIPKKNSKVWNVKEKVSHESRTNYHL